MLSLDESFTRKQERILDQNKNQREDASSTSELPVPSCDLLDLSPSPSVHGATLGELGPMNAQLSDLKSCYNKQLETKSSSTDGFVSSDKHRNTRCLLKRPGKTSPEVLHMRVFQNIQMQCSYCSQLVYRPFQKHCQVRDCHPCPVITQQ